MNHTEQAAQTVRGWIADIQGVRHGDGGAIGEAISRLEGTGGRAAEQPVIELPVWMRPLVRWFGGQQRALNEQLQAIALLNQALNRLHSTAEAAIHEQGWLEGVLSGLTREPPFGRPGQSAAQPVILRTERVLNAITAAQQELVTVGESLSLAMETRAKPHLSLKVEDLSNFKRLMVVERGSSAPRRAQVHDVGELLWEAVHLLRHPDPETVPPTFDQARAQRVAVIEEEVRYERLLGSNSSLQPVLERYAPLFWLGPPLGLGLLLALHRWGIMLLQSSTLGTFLPPSLSLFQLCLRTALTILTLSGLLTTGYKLLLSLVGAFNRDLGPLRLNAWKTAVTDLDLRRADPDWRSGRSRETHLRVLLNAIPQERLIQALLDLPMADAARRSRLLTALAAVTPLRPRARSLLAPWMPTGLPDSSEPWPVDNAALLPLLFQPGLLRTDERHQLLAELAPEHAVVVAAVLEENVIDTASQRAFDEGAYFPGRLRAAVAGEVWDEGTLQGVRRYFQAHPGSEQKILFSEGYIRGANQPGVPNKSRIKPKATNLVLSHWLGAARRGRPTPGGQPLPDSVEILDAEDIPHRLQYLSIAIVFEATQTAVAYLLEHAEGPDGLEVSRLRPGRLRSEARGLFDLARRWRIDLHLPTRLEREYTTLVTGLNRLTEHHPDGAPLRDAFLQVYPTAALFVASEFEVRSVPAVVQGILELLPWGHYYGKSRHSILEYRQLAKRGLTLLGLPFPLDGTTNSFRMQTLVGLDPRTLAPIPRRQLQEALSTQVAAELSPAVRRMLGRLKSLQPLDPHPPDDIIEDAHMGLRSAERGLRVFLMTDPYTQTFEEPLPVAPAFYAQRSRWISPQPHGPFWAASLAFLPPLLALLMAGLGGALFGSRQNLLPGMIATGLGLGLGLGAGLLMAPLLTRLGARLGWIRQGESLEDRVQQPGLAGVLSVALFQSGYLSTVMAFLGFGVAIAWGLAGLLQLLLTLPLTGPLRTVLTGLDVLDPLLAGLGAVVDGIPPAAWFVPSPLAGVLVFLVPMLLTVLATLWALFAAGLDDARLVQEALLALEASEEELRSSQPAAARAWRGPSGSLSRLREAIARVRRDRQGRLLTSSLRAVSHQLHRELQARSLPLLPARLLERACRSLVGETIADAELERLLHDIEAPIELGVLRATQQQADALQTHRERLAHGHLRVELPGLVAGLFCYGLGWYGWTTLLTTGTQLLSGLLLAVGGLLMAGAALSAWRGQVVTLGPVCYFRLSHIGLAFTLPLYHLQLIPAMLRTTAQLWQRLDNIWPKTSHGSQTTLHREVERQVMILHPLQGRLWGPLMDRVSALASPVAAIWRIPGLRFVLAYLVVPATTIVGLYCHNALAQAGLETVIAEQIQPLRNLQLNCARNPLRPLLGDLRPELTRAYVDVFADDPELLIDWARSSLELLAVPDFQTQFQAAHPNLKGDDWWEHLEQHRRALLTDAFAQVDAYVQLSDARIKAHPAAARSISATCLQRLKSLEPALSRVGLPESALGIRALLETQ